MDRTPPVGVVVFHHEAVSFLDVGTIFGGVTFFYILY